MEKNEIFEDPIMDDIYEVEDNIYMISGDDCEEEPQVRMTKEEKQEESESTQFIDADHRKEMEAMKGQFEGILTTLNKTTLYSIKSDNAWQMKNNLLYQMEQYKAFTAEGMRWFVIKDRVTVVSGYWKGKTNRYDREPRQYYRQENKGIVEEKERRYTIRCLESGEQFYTIQEAADKYGVAYNSVRSAAIYGWEAAELHWIKMDENGNDIEWQQYGEYRGESLSKKRANPKPKAPAKEKKEKTKFSIKCVETGEVYKNTKEAGNALEVDPNTIYFACRYGWSLRKNGLHYKRIRNADGVEMEYEEFVAAR